MPDPGAAVFDLDDTLFLERDYVHSGFRAVEPLVRARFGLDGFAAAAWRLFLDGHRATIFDRVLADAGVPFTPADVLELVTAYRRHHPDITLLPDAAEALLRLRERGTPIAVLSDGARESQRAKVRALGLDRLADVVVLTDGYGPGFAKPHPRGFREVETRLPGTDRVYFADNPQKDFVTPRQLGWTTVRVRRPGGLHASRAHGAEVDQVVGDLSDLGRSPAR